MTFKKAEMAKTLRNGLSMIERNPFNHRFGYLVGVGIAPVLKKPAVKVRKSRKKMLSWIHPKNKSWGNLMY